MGDPERGEGGKDERGQGGDVPERAPLGILFLAAAVGLALLLGVVGLIGVAALSP